ncbi:hypothetical protein ACFE04_027091 [Oxalis oulophora]
MKYGTKLAKSHAFNFKTITNSNNDVTGHQKLCHVIQSCNHASHHNTVTQTHTRIIKLGYQTFPSVISSLLTSYTHCGHISNANQLFDEMSRIDLLSVNLVIENLIRLREVDIARKLFRQMRVRDVVTWNSMISGYVKNARYEEALRLFRQMVGSGVEPDKFTFSSVLAGCARVGAVSNAVWVHGLMVEKRIEMNFILNAALIDMYAKCGRIETAKGIFYNVERDHVCVWNAMINGLAVHGLGMDTIAVFTKMELEKVFPDSITFVGILTACSHCGFVAEGRKYFELMKSSYSIEPQLEHYGAMVDLLGRSGLLEEAYALIEAMPMKPDVIIWRAILSACRTYKNPEMGKLAIANIVSSQSGDYVLLSNMYCSLNNWGNAEQVREMMKKKGVRKTKGKSWLDVAGVITQFKAGDRSHRETEALYKVLEGLIHRTKMEGFMPATELVLMDVSEEEKEENLYHHSEKLALAYGILKTCPGSEIRISKNLRICDDCHRWIKLVSKMLSRVIIVRDRIRFHRFEGGLCSCGDYW